MHSPTEFSRVCLEEGTRSASPVALCICSLQGGYTLLSPRQGAPVAGQGRGLLSEEILDQEAHFVMQPLHILQTVLKE